MEIKKLESEYFESKLNNGARVILFKRPNSPISIQASFVAGSFLDTKGLEGIAHFLEHLIMLGKKNFDSKEDMAEYIESVGGIYGAFTSKEFLSVRIQVPEKEDMGRVIKILDSTIVNPIFGDSDIEKERGIISSEIERYESDTNRVLTERVLSNLFKESEFEHVVIGDKESLSKIDLKSLIDFKDKALVAERLTFVVSGDIEIDELLEKLNALDIKKSDENIEYPEIKINNKAFEFDFPESKQANIYFGFKEISVDKKNLILRRLVFGVLCGSRNSRIIKKLRAEEGLIYSASAFAYPAFENSFFGVHVPIPRKYLDVGKDYLKEIFEDLFKNGINQNELDFIKNKFIKSKKIQMQTSDSWVDFHSRGEVLNLRSKQNLDEYNINVSNASIEDINSYIKNNLNPKDICIICAK